MAVSLAYLVIHINMDQWRPAVLMGDEASSHDDTLLYSGAFHFLDSIGSIIISMPDLHVVSVIAEAEELFIEEHNSMPFHHARKS
ncbi:hypothetical protein TNCV_4618241 [Trichonephila clavipes]|nr:hypothetical protein TNCV_4618241 [Trichonephila clavipes]